MKLTFALFAFSQMLVIIWTMFIVIWFTVFRKISSVCCCRQFCLGNSRAEFLAAFWVQIRHTCRPHSLSKWSSRKTFTEMQLCHMLYADTDRPVYEMMISLHNIALSDQRREDLIILQGHGEALQAFLFSHEHARLFLNVTVGHLEFNLFHFRVKSLGSNLPWNQCAQSWKQTPQAAILFVLFQESLKKSVQNVPNSWRRKGKIPALNRKINSNLDL